MAELTVGAVRAAAEACAAAWGGARLAAAARDADAAPRFDTVFGRWPLLGSSDALDVALDVPALATWVVAARVRAAVAPYSTRLDAWRRRATVRVPGGPVVAWADVSERLASLAGDAVTRRALGAARARVAAAELAPLARERVARSCAAVEGLAVAGGYDETFARLTGETPEARTTLGAEWLARTEAAWSDMLAERARRTVGLPVRELEAADLPAVFAAGGDAIPLGASALAAAVRTQLAAMHLDPDAGGRLHPAALGAPAGRAARAIPVRVPHEVYLLSGTRAGPDAARVYLEAFGQALHRAHVDPALPFEVRWQANAGAVRATGALLAALLRDRGWLRRYAGLSGGALDAVARAAAFAELGASRATAARVAASAAAYGDTASLGEVEGVYVERMRQALGVTPEPGDAWGELDGPFAVGDALRGSLMAGALGEALRERFDEDWWRNPRSGAWLVAEWFGAAAEPQAAVAPEPLAAALTRVLQ